MTETAEQSAAKIEYAFYNFFKAHFRTDNLSSCHANRSILEKYCDDNLLDVTNPTSLEIAFLAVGNQLVRTVTPEAPAAPEAPAPVDQIPRPEDLTEQEQLRQILRVERDPKTIANQMRAILQTKDAHAKTQQTTLPTTITKDALLKDRFLLRKMIERFGSSAVDDRLNGRN